MAKFKGSQCLTKGCGGHKAGFKYASGGGGQPAKYSPSFNKGMKLAPTKAAKPKNVSYANKRK